MEPKLVPYLIFKGNAGEAMNFYQSVFGGELEMQTYGEAMKEAVPEQKDKIMHAELKNGPLSFMGSDGAPGTVAQKTGFPVRTCVTPRDERRRTRWTRRRRFGALSGDRTARAHRRDERFTTSAFPLDTPRLPFAASFRPAVSVRATRGSPRRGTG